MGAIFQGNEYIILLLLLLLVLGPSKLPQIARFLGKAVREFRRAVEGVYEELEAAASLEEVGRGGVGKRRAVAPSSEAGASSKREEANVKN